MGSSGKSGNVFDWAINPLNIVGMGEYDPLATMTSQSWKNTWNVATGKENFAQHDNWFGHGFVGDFLNPVMGGRSDAQRTEAARIDKLWQNYYADKYSVDTVPGTEVTKVTKVSSKNPQEEQRRKVKGKKKIDGPGQSLLDS